MAGFLDKAKQAAQQALDEAKKGIDSGQAKLDEVQVKKESERLLSALGAAYYAQQRHGGSTEAVETALGSLDTHVQTHGMVGFPAAAVTPDTADSPAPAPGPEPTPAPPPSSGGSDYDLPPTS